MSCWPAVAPLLITRCLYLGWGHQGGCRGSWGCQGVLGYIRNIKMGYCKILLKTQDSLLWTIEHELNATGAKLVPFLACQIALWEGVHLNWGQLYVHWYHYFLRSVLSTLLPFFAQFSCIYASTILHHQIPLLGGSKLGMSESKCQGDLMSDCKCQVDLTSDCKCEADLM